MARSKCDGCGLTFNSTSAFDTHRTGEYESRDPKGRVLRPSTHRCMTEEEMRARKMAPNDRGFWATEPPAAGIFGRIFHRQDAEEAEE